MSDKPTCGRYLAILTCAIATLLACGASDSDTPGTPDAAVPTPDTNAPSDVEPAADPSLVGAFNVRLDEATTTSPARTSVSGIVYDGPTAANIAWDLTEASGGCQLFRARAPFCDPGCAGNDICAPNGQCLRPPVSQDLGLVTMRGLGDGEIQLEGIANSYELPIGLSLPFPPATEGADIEVSASAGLYGPFAISSKAVAPLLAPSSDFAMEKGKAMQVTWTPPGQPSLAHMRVYVDISHHGGTKGKIDCEVPDNGSMEIAASLVTGLIDLGVAGFPKIELHRYSSATAAVSAGVVKLEVDSWVVRPVQIVGFTSCNTDADCPTGKTCLPNALCQQ
jgi:hypothetical protein